MHYCPKCHRPLESSGAECLHGLGPSPELWDGGASMTPEELVKEYGYSIEEAREILKSIGG